MQRDDCQVWQVSGCKPDLRRRDVIVAGGHCRARTSSRSRLLSMLVGFYPLDVLINNLPLLEGDWVAVDGLCW